MRRGQKNMTCDCVWCPWDGWVGECCGKCGTDCPNPRLMSKPLNPGDRVEATRLIIGLSKIFPGTRGTLTKVERTYYIVEWDDGRYTRFPRARSPVEIETEWDWIAPVSVLDRMAEI